MLALAYLILCVLMNRPGGAGGSDEPRVRIGGKAREVQTGAAAEFAACPEESVGRNVDGETAFGAGVV